MMLKLKRIRVDSFITVTYSNSNKIATLISYSLNGEYETTLLVGVHCKSKTDCHAALKSLLDEEYNYGN